MAFLGGLIPAGEGVQSASSFGQRIEIVLIPGAIHYDFLLPADVQTRRAFNFGAAAGVPVHHPNVEWIVVGWGAERFYTSAESYETIGFDAVLRAVTGDKSVMRLDAVGSIRPGTQAKKLSLTQLQYNRLLRSITDSFQRDTFDGVEVLGLPGFTDHDRFFRARQKFNALYTCNAWVGDQLRNAGLKFGVWTPTTYAVSLSLSEHQGVK